MKPARIFLLVLAVLVLLALVWAPLFLSDSLEQNADSLPISTQTQVWVNLLASFGVLFLLGLLFFLRRKK